MESQKLCKERSRKETMACSSLSQERPVQGCIVIAKNPYLAFPSRRGATRTFSPFHKGIRSATNARRDWARILFRSAKLRNIVAVNAISVTPVKSPN